MNVLEEIKISRGIKRLRKQRREAKEQKYANAKRYSDLRCALEYRKTDLISIDADIKSVKTIIRDAINFALDNEDATIKTYELTDYMNELIDLRDKKQTIKKEIEDIKREMYKLEESIGLPSTDPTKNISVNSKDEMVM